LRPEPTATASISGPGLPVERERRHGDRWRRPGSRRSGGWRQRSRHGRWPGGGHGSGWVLSAVRLVW